MQGTGCGHFVYKGSPNEGAEGKEKEMKGYLRAAIVMTAVLILAGTARAAEDNWRIDLKADDGAGMGAGPAMHIGVYPTSSDGLDGQDLLAQYAVDVGQFTIWAAGNLGDGYTYGRDIKAGDLALPKVWDLRVAALPLSTYSAIRLQFSTIHPSYMPPASVSGSPVWYELEMINNRGVAGAPAGGTIWDVSAITTGGYVVSPNLPILKLSAPTHAAMLNEGYVLQFRQVVPEPAGLIALASGIMGLAGFALRIRRGGR